MATFDICTATPSELAATTVCLDELSKDLVGELVPNQAIDHHCPTWDCRTLVTDHSLVLEAGSHACDSKVGALLDGQISAKSLVTVWTDGDPQRRGIHRGLITWRTADARLRGQLSGVTNVGTHREPAFGGCQRCDEVGVMEGQLCAQVARSADPVLNGAQVYAAYRLRFDPTKEGGAGRVEGTMEGVVLRTCGADQDCLQFATVGTAANPRVLGPLTIETSDHSGPTPDSQVVAWGAITGLHLWYASTFTFASPVSRVELTLAHFAQPSTATAVDAAGNHVAQATTTPTQGTPQQLVLTGAGITSVKVDSPADETLLLSVCWMD